jgi:hypothetical protein
MIALSKGEIDRTQSQPELNDLARIYHSRFLECREIYVDHLKCDLVEAFKRFQDSRTPGYWRSSPVRPLMDSWIVRLSPEKEMHYRIGRVYDRAWTRCERRSYHHGVRETSSRRIPSYH